MLLAFLKCFPAGTQIVVGVEKVSCDDESDLSSFMGTEDGATAVATRKKLRYITKGIEDLRVGDMVLARDEHGHDIGYRPVVDLLRNVSRAMATLTFMDEIGHTATIDTTPAHPFWNETQQQFMKAGDLEIGDIVIGPDCDTLRLIEGQLRHEPHGISVYNLTVDGYHTYYVVPQRTADGGDEGGTELPPILVHNASCKKKGGGSGGDSDANAKRNAEADAEVAKTEAEVGKEVGDVDASNGRGLWKVGRFDKVVRWKKGKIYRDPGTGLWWSKDIDGHGGSAWKVFKEEGKGLRWVEDADEYGDFIRGKHKGSVGLFLPWSELGT